MNLCLATQKSLRGILLAKSQLGLHLACESNTSLSVLVTLDPTSFHHHSLMKEMIYTDSHQSEWSTPEHSSLLGRRSLVLPHLCHLNKWRTSMIHTSEKPTLVFVQLGWWRDIFHLRYTITRCWQSQWSCSGKSPKWVQRCPHLHQIPHQLWKWRRRPNRQTNPKISNQSIYDNSNNTHCPLSLWDRKCQYVNCHGHHNPTTIPYPSWRSRPIRWRTTRSRRRWRPSRRQWTGWRQCPASPTGRKAHGCTTNNFWRRLLKSWEFHQRVLHIPPS